jgi:ATP-citrate lyase beta-subunit
MVAGGGASVIYADTVVDLGFANELACYGEYSGDPSTELTYEYAKTLLDLMTRTPDPQGREKFLLIGGGIANFTDVAKTFTGIIQALKAYKDKLHASHVKIFVRRGGPNYKEGLENIRRAGKEIGVPIEVYGPETHMTRIVSMALKGGNSNAS